MEGDSVRSTLLFFVILFIIFFLYSLAEVSLTEIPNQRVKAFEHEKGTKHSLFKLLKKPAKLHMFFRQIHALSAVFSFFPAALSASVITNPIFYIISDGYTEHYIYRSGTDLIINAVLTCIIGLVIGSAVFYAAPRSIVLGMNTEDTERMALFFTPLVSATLVIFTPVIALSLAITKRPDGAEVTEEEILLMVDAGSDTGAIEESQAEMISNIFEFSDTLISDIMTHRTDIIAVKNTASPLEIAEKSAESGFSRLPVYNGSVDKIIGIICVKDLLPLISGGAHEKDASEYLRPVIYLPETATAKNVFKKLRDNKMQMAVITDEYGGTAGIVTMEDLLEEIVGSIQDEYDDETEKITKLHEWAYNIDGLADPIDVLTELGLHIPDENDEKFSDYETFDNFDTMSAFLIALAGVLPQDSDKIEAVYDGWKFSSVEVNDMRITNIRAEKCPETGELTEITANSNDADEKSD